jgi:hypothetical protein
MDIETKKNYLDFNIKSSLYKFNELRGQILAESYIRPNEDVSQNNYKLCTMILEFMSIPYKVLAKYKYYICTLLSINAGDDKVQSLHQFDTIYNKISGDYVNDIKTFYSSFDTKNKNIGNDILFFHEIMEELDIRNADTHAYVYISFSSKSNGSFSRLCGEIVTDAGKNKIYYIDDLINGIYNFVIKIDGEFHNLVNKLNKIKEIEDTYKKDFIVQVLGKDNVLYNSGLSCVCDFKGNLQEIDNLEKYCIELSDIKLNELFGNIDIIPNVFFIFGRDITDYHIYDSQYELKRMSTLKSMNTKLKSIIDKTYEGIFGNPYSDIFYNKIESLTYDNIKYKIHNTNIDTLMNSNIIKYVIKKEKFANIFINDDALIEEFICSNSDNIVKYHLLRMYKNGEINIRQCIDFINKYISSNDEKVINFYKYMNVKYADDIELLCLTISKLIDSCNYDFLKQHINFSNLVMKIYNERNKTIIDKMTDKYNRFINLIFELVKKLEYDFDHYQYMLANINVNACDYVTYITKTMNENLFSKLFVSGKLAYALFKRESMIDRNDDEFITIRNIINKNKEKIIQGCTFNQLEYKFEKEIVAYLICKCKITLDIKNIKSKEIRSFITHCNNTQKNIKQILQKSKPITTENKL